MKEEENHRINTQLKMTSLEQVCFVCLFSFKISICNCYYELYKMAKKDGKEETRRIYIQLKMTSLQQVCFTCMFIFKLIIYNVWYGAYKMATKYDRRKLSKKY